MVMAVQRERHRVELVRYGWWSGRRQNWIHLYLWRKQIVFVPSTHTRIIQRFPHLQIVLLVMLFQNFTKMCAKTDMYCFMGQNVCLKLICNYVAPFPFHISSNVPFYLIKITFISLLMITQPPSPPPLKTSRLQNVNSVATSHITIYSMYST